MACQPSDEPEGDTDTTPECGEDETAVVSWCEDAARMINDIDCYQCGYKDSCEYEFPLDFVCNILTSNYGKLPDCVSDNDAAHCLAELTRNACEEEIYRWWQQCEGFSL
jgi:hypothetical protein